MMCGFERGFGRKGRGFEDKIRRDLESRGIRYEYESIKLEYTIIHPYTPDFILPNGIIVETKGWFLSKDRTKHLAIKKAYPHLDIRFVFQRANQPLSKKSKTTYEEWCKKHKFIYSIGFIPNEWLED